MTKAWAFLLASFQRRAGERLDIHADASRLIERDGPLAYNTAREFARTFREHGRRPDLARYWSRVAAHIAFRTGREVGVKAADRYERGRRSR